MKTRSIIYFVYRFVLIQLLDLPQCLTIKCFHDHPYLENSTCEGDFCVAIRPGIFNSQAKIRTCITGAKKPSIKCSLYYDDEMECYCDTDFCNVPSIFHSNLTVQPIIECKEVHGRDYAPSACNTCERIMSYLKFDGTDGITEVNEYIQCAKSGESGFFVIDPLSTPKEMIARNFYTDACYNVSMHSEHFHVFCRCRKANCNSPESSLPYPISDPTIKCFTSGFDDDVNRNRYEKKSEDVSVFYQGLMKNDSYSDDGVECLGHYCFIAIDEGYLDNELVYYKGCISLNEQGEYKIKLGFSFLNGYSYYFCNTDHCNMNLKSAMDPVNTNSVVIGQSQKNNIERNLLPLTSYLMILIPTIFELY